MTYGYLTTIDGLSTAGALLPRTFRPLHAALRLTDGGQLPTILIVDDHAAVRAAIRDLFETCLAPIVCGEAENGLDAIAKAETLKPDLIVLDLSMPVMNGFEAAKIFHEVWPAIPIFMLTAHYMAETEQAALQVGIRAVFSKHKDLAPLVAQARQLFAAY